MMMNMLSETIGSRDVSGQDPDGMRWVDTPATTDRPEHWRYLDRYDRIVGVVTEDIGIFKPVYEAAFALGQYASWAGAKRAMEMWHLHLVMVRLELAASAGGTPSTDLDTSDWLIVSKSVVDLALRKKQKNAGRDPTKEGQ